MGTIKENLNQWSSYHWNQEGDEWSGPWGGSASMWYGTLLPRIQAVAKGHRFLEIAPGYGRCTQFLLKLCDRLTVVDLTQKCIEACQKKFAEYSHLDYHVNDGKSLEFLEDNSIDFVFSWDSLVHANDEVLASYLRELSKKMKPGGFGFIHHSNLGEYRDPNTGMLTIESQHWRDGTMSAELFREFCARAGLRCVAQEIIEWETGVLSDSMSLFTKSSDMETDGETRIFENREFMLEVENLRRIRDLYSPLTTPTFAMNSEAA